MSRTAEEIRADLLANLQTEFQTLNLRIVTADQSPAYALATAIAIEIEGPEAEAEAARREAHPATASEEGVLRHAEFDGLTRIPAARAVLRVRVEGTPSALLTIPEGAELTSPDGLVFIATAGVVTTQSSGYAFTTVTARDAGASGNLVLGTTLRWQPAPSDFAPTALTALDSGDVTHFLVVGSSEETIEELRRRVVRYQREDARAGGRADWVEWSEDVEGVGSAFVYPRVWRHLGAWQLDLPGVLVLIPLGAPPPEGSYAQNADGTMGLGLSFGFTRSPSSTLCTRVKDYIEGRVYRDGSPMPLALREQLRSVGVAEANYTVEPPGLRAVPITVTVETDPGVAPWPWPWTSPAFRTVVSATTTAITVDSATGIRPGTRVAVQLGTGVVRGGWWVAMVATVVGNVVTLASVLPAAPAPGALVRPDCGLWTEVRRLVLEAFDALGPGDQPTPVACQRFPRPQYESADRITASGVIVAASDIIGVVSVVVEFPDDLSASQIAAIPGQLLVPGEIIVAQP